MVVITETPPSTPTLYRTATPTNTPSQLEVLIGTDYKFVIHKVLTGEDLNQYATKYNTSVDAIKAVNYGQDPIPWVNTLLVIPVDFTDYSRLPSFVIYEVKREEVGISVDDMAKRLRVSPLDLKYYNGWTSPGDRPLVGDLLLVPRPRPIQ
jgi:LysM repeat protein